MSAPYVWEGTMSTREQLLTLLSQAALNQTWVSGEDAAQQLGVSRAAIWKAIKTLEEEGCHFEAQRNRGYRLAEHQDVITKSDLDAALANAKLPVETQVVFSTGSTNNDVKALAEQGKDELFALVASKQESGKGRRGRSFFSLGDRGVYLSILIRPSMPIAQASAITAVAAVATCRAVESLFDVKPSIKWVNDVYLGKRKICGILTEAATDLETGMLSYAVVGIGVNVYEPEGGFPEEIRERAGAISTEIKQGTRAALAGAIIKEFVELYDKDSFGAFCDEYRARSFVVGKTITVIDGKGEQEALALGIDDDLSLHVQFEDGSEAHLHSGEVSLRV